MAKKLTNKDAARINYGKLYQCDFGGETFTVEGAVRFNGAKVAEAMNEAKSSLNSLSNTFEKLAKAYDQIIKNCGTTGFLDGNTKLEDDNEFGKELKKFKKKLNNRSKYCKDRVKTLQNAIESASIETINVNTTAQQSIEAANNASTAAEQDS